MKTMRLCVCFFLLLGITFLPTVVRGQNSVGLPFLKIGIGARPAGMGGVFTGVGDDIYTMYWNPGGLGHIRMWQWSAAYNRWFTDVYQASLSYVKQFRLFGSRKTTFGLGGSYLGMPSWDATGGKEQPVSAGHFSVNISVGQRLDWISRALSIGVNFMAISSRFDTYSASGLATDAGLLIRPGRFRLGSMGVGLFDYGIVTCGVSLLHYGAKMTFDREASSLPRTIRAGISFLMGRYQGFSLLLASDAVGVQDREWVFGVGAEMWWRNTLGVRMGYRADGEDLGNFSFGIGLRWDDVMNSIFRLPTRYGDAIEVNVADAGYGDVLSQTYRGAVSHYPIAPEPFRLEDPQVVTSRVIGESSTVRLSWEKAFDPDPFDEVGYFVFIDKDKQKVDRAIRWVERDMEGFLASPLRDSLMVCEAVSTTSYTTSVTEGGVYHWAVAAHDLAKHARLAKRGAEHIAQFVIATPDLVVRECVFTHSRWITTTPEQGTLSFTVANEGSVDAEGFRFVATDVFVGDTLKRILLDVEIPALHIGKDTTFQVSWATQQNGLHFVDMIADPDSRILELQKKNNVRRDEIVSIPKGVLSAADSVEVTATGYDQIDIPLVPEVYFAPHSSDVQSIFYERRDIFPDIFSALAERLNENRDVTLHVMGSIDTQSGENDPTLADDRAERVKEKLLELGVTASQVSVIKDHPSKILGREQRRTDSQDIEWVSEHSRVVTFSVAEQDEERIFEPIGVAVDTTLSDGGIPFGLQIMSPGRIQDWHVGAEPRSIEIVQSGLARGDSLSGVFEWNGMDTNDVLVPRNRWYRYSLVLTDTLKRTFMTRPDSIYLRERRTLQRWEMFGAAKFAKTEPIYQFYWERLMSIGSELVQNPSMRVRFEGHACKVGSDAVNDRLSLARAQAFTQAFKERLRRTYPNDYREIWSRIDDPVGFGEKVPLVLKTKERGEILLGDNQSPIGRYRNRRIMVMLYKEN